MIIYENKTHWVERVSKGHYAVYRVEGTHSVKRATIHFSDRPDYALRRAIKEADDRDGRNADPLIAFASVEQARHKAWKADFPGESETERWLRESKIC